MSSPSWRYAKRKPTVSLPRLCLAQRPKRTGRWYLKGAQAGDGRPVPPGPAGPAKPQRFHGSVALRSERLNLEFGRVVQEVVQRLADAGATVVVTVEVSATARDGFEEPAVRTVTENAKTLHFKDQGFEEA